MMKNVMMMKSTFDIDPQIIVPGEVLLIGTTIEEIIPLTQTEMKSIIINKSGTIKIKYSQRRTVLSGGNIYNIRYILKKNGTQIYLTLGVDNPLEVMIDAININVSIGDIISLEGYGTTGYQAYARHLGLYGNTFTPGFGTIING